MDIQNNDKLIQKISELLEQGKTSSDVLNSLPIQSRAQAEEVLSIIKEFKLISDRTNPDPKILRELIQTIPADQLLQITKGREQLPNANSINQPFTNMQIKWNLVVPVLLIIVAAWYFTAKPDQMPKQTAQQTNQEENQIQTPAQTAVQPQTKFVASDDPDQIINDIMAYAESEFALAQEENGDATLAIQAENQSNNIDQIYVENEF